MSTESAGDSIAPLMAALVHDWRSVLQSIGTNAEILGLACLPDQQAEAVRRITRTADAALQRLQPLVEVLKSPAGSPGTCSDQAALRKALAAATRGPKGESR